MKKKKKKKNENKRGEENWMDGWVGGCTHLERNVTTFAWEV
jgi:hypothetical protein